MYLTVKTKDGVKKVGQVITKDDICRYTVLDLDDFNKKYKIHH